MSKMSGKKLRESTVNGVFDQREKYLIIGLTGKNGSGCSTTASIFAEPMQDVNLSCPEPGLNGLDSDLERESRIIQRYIKGHQKQFEILKVRDIIASFLLESIDTWQRFEKDYCTIKKISKKDVNIWDDYKEFCNKQESEMTLIITSLDDLIDRNEVTFHKDINEITKEEYEYVTKILPSFARFIHEKLGVAYTDLFQKYGNEIRFWGTLNPNERDAKIQVKEIFYDLRNKYLQKKKKGDANIWPIKIESNDTGRDKCEITEEEYYNFEREANTIYAIAERVNRTIKIMKNTRPGKGPVSIVIDSMKNIYESNYLKDRYTAFYLISITKEENNRLKELQTSGVAFTRQDIANIDYNERPSAAKKDLSKFIRILKSNIKEYEDNRKKSVGFYDDNIKKYFEAILDKNESVLWQYVKEDKGEICCSLEQLKMSIDDSNNIWIHNYSDAREMLIPSQYEYYLKIICDPLRVFLYVSNLYAFYAQDVETCIQNSDIFLTNNEQDGKNSILRRNILKYVSLMLHPGLVPPTPIERCMQIAYTAKINSGCISRQVGAVVTDSKYQILSLSWNDVPCGQTSCVYRNMIDIYRQNDLPAYSNYEIDIEDEFQKYLKRTYKFDSLQIEKILNGLPGSYCFKDTQEKIMGNRNPMDARSMHGEEKALLACDQQRVIGGFLFTTSSPCEMCAKNAKEHQISKIYYIEPYPGISQKNICDSGKKGNRAEYVLFEGAIGRAYNQLYTPIMPYKDELKLRGFPDDFKNDINVIMENKAEDIEDNIENGTKYMQELDKSEKKNVGFRKTFIPKSSKTIKSKDF